MIWTLVLSATILFAEEPPPAEYPYPARASKTNNPMGVEKPLRKNTQGEYFYSTDTDSISKEQNTIKGVEKPYKVGEDGAYYYGDEESTKEAVKSYEGVEQPEERDDDGSYYYSRETKKTKPSAKYGPPPTRINEDGSYLYQNPVGETRNTLAIKGGLASPPKVSTNSGTTYDDVYGDQSKFVLSIEYDWRVSKDLFFKFASGVTSTQGQGRFAADEGRSSRESFQFFVFPNTFTLAYKMNIDAANYLVPYVEGGLGYFTFIESRSDSDIFAFDGDGTKLGGAFVGVAAGGLLISIPKLMGQNTFSTEYSATQAWIDLQFKQILGLDKRKDFTSNMITGGIAVGF